MSHRTLMFFPHNPCPPLSGAHRRCLESLATITALGSDVTFASSDLSSESPWPDPVDRGVGVPGAGRVRVFRAGKRDFQVKRALGRYYAARKQEPPVGTRMLASGSMRRWFMSLVEETRPDTIVMNYSQWDRIIRHSALGPVSTAIDTHDLMTVNLRFVRAVKRHLQVDTDGISRLAPMALAEDFFEHVANGTEDREFRALDRYHFTIAISRSDQRVIESKTRRTRVLFAPVSVPPRYIANQYSGPALLTLGPNVFNLQGYCYFVERVLPVLRPLAPTFTLEVTGNLGGMRVAESPVTSVRGFVPDLTPAYEAASLFACPVFGGTGQQVKIVEAMAHGLPVVALARAAAGAPIEHGRNGLVASGAEEFAEHLALLWGNRALARRLGLEARRTIAELYSSTSRTEVWQEILEGRAACP